MIYDTHLWFNWRISNTVCIHCTRHSEDYWSIKLDKTLRYVLEIDRYLFWLISSFDEEFFHNQFCVCFEIWFVGAHHKQQTIEDVSIYFGSSFYLGKSACIWCKVLKGAIGHYSIQLVALVMNNKGLCIEWDDFDRFYNQLLDGLRT